MTTKNLEVAFELDENQVLDYLQEHPSFLKQHADLLSNLAIQHPTEGSVSLIEHQVKRLREEKKELENRLQNMLGIAEQNEALLQKCSNFLTCAMACSSFSSLCVTITDVLPRSFDVDVATLVLFGDWPQGEHVRVEPNSHILRQSLEHAFPEKQPVFSRIGKTIYKSVLSTTDCQSGSAALIPLGGEITIGLLTLASHDQKRFSPDMGTLFTELLSRLLTHMLMKFQSD